MKLLLRVAIACLAALCLWAPAAAQGEPWRERATGQFLILYPEPIAAEAERYAGFVDDIYEELSALFSFRTPTPLTLRLFPTSEDYYQVNPQARQVPGVVAHADFRRRELVVIIERTLQQTEEEVRNNIRHELTHIIAADLSANRLNVGFQEGVAQYLERPAPELERRVEALRLARDQGLLLPWSAFDSRDEIYGRPDVGYPQALSVVAFLVEREGFGRLREFLELSAGSSGYRSALERAYGVSATRLESEWLDWLPGYLDGGYRRNALVTYDLTFPRRLVEEGRYAEAETELNQALAWLEQNRATQPPEVVAEAAALLDLSQAGLRAERLAEAVRTALAQGDYGQAQQLLAQARDRYVALGDTRQDAVLADYSARIARGLAATQQLLLAGELARALRYPQARAAADAAAAEFAALGDQIRLANALSLRQQLDGRQRLLGGGLLAAGVAFVIISLAGLVRQREPEPW